MSWLSYKRRTKTPTPPWLFWGVLVFIIYGLYAYSRNPQLAQQTNWNLLNVDAYKAQVLPDDLGKPVEAISAPTPTQAKKKPAKKPPVEENTDSEDEKSAVQEDGVAQ